MSKIIKSTAIFIAIISCKIGDAQPEQLGYHPIKTDLSGKIIAWNHSDPGKAYTDIITRVWHFWDTMRTDLNGLPYYMNHQVWNAGVNDKRGVAGSQFEMALNSWRLLYQFSGDERLVENMRFIADYYLSHSLSPANALWPNIPYPYNTLLYAGKYDGDMVIGRNYTQPDKAGSFANELLYLYKLVGNGSHGQTPTHIYLNSAIDIANTLTKNIIPGDADHSPLPFKVHALLGANGVIKDMNGKNEKVISSAYTTNWSGTIELLLSLIEMKTGNTIAYQKAVDMLLQWMKKYPLKNNRWGPFFEDIVGWSDTQINAISFAQFMMNHPQYFPDWKASVKKIFDWVYEKVGNKKWDKYGVIVINEQTAYQMPGNSHSARQAAAELQYMKLTGDSTYKENAIRMLNWATYMVDAEGRNQYLNDDHWLSDGYGDYIRHYLNAFAAMPLLAPVDEDHILSSTSVVQMVQYPNSPYKRPDHDERPSGLKILYKTYHRKGIEVIRLTHKPSKIWFNSKLASELIQNANEGYQWQALEQGGLLRIHRMNCNEVIIFE
ncbi:MAG: hypothetical protein EAZ35_02565 [Sphingobacteriia bacterium]|nr:MAG: hypothetical protein EAZ35_02565 [Sphingobacteriia bacterium]